MDSPRATIQDALITAFESVDWQTPDANLALGLASAVEAALIHAATEADSHDHGGPKFLVHRIRDGKLEAVDCPSFVLLAKDKHALIALRKHLAALANCPEGHSDQALKSMDEHCAEFAHWQPKKEPD